MGLVIEQLSKTYNNGVKALDNINLTIENGLFGLLGPNGAGKSSLMRILATLQDSDEGSAILNGTNIASNKHAIRKQLGYLPQEFGVYPSISALDLLDHYAVLKGIKNRQERKEQIDALLNQVNLYDHRKKAVYKYSGGMKQRFGIAQALLGNPKLIIVDEPTAGLDPAERNRFNNLLSETSEEKVVLLSTHIVKDVSDLCGDMAIMTNGRILLNGRPKTLIQQLNGNVWKKEIRKEEYEDYAAEHKIISAYLREGNPIIHVLNDSCPHQSFSSVSPNLEDVYFSSLN